jgi:CSLREA domain-containing protein
MTRNRWQHLVRSLFVPKSARGSSSRLSGKRTPKNRFRATFERLDDRVVPSVVTVNTLADETNVANELSLRDALKFAADGDTIQFASSLDGGTITLNSTLGQLVIQRSETIDAVTGLSKVSLSAATTQIESLKSPELVLAPA